MSEGLKLILAGVLALLGKIVFDWLNGKREVKHGNGSEVKPSNGSSGQRPVEYWRDFFRDQIREGNDEVMDLIKDFKKETRENLADIKEDIIRLLARS